MAAGGAARNGGVPATSLPGANPAVANIEGPVEAVGDQSDGHAAEDIGSVGLRCQLAQGAIDSLDLTGVAMARAVDGEEAERDEHDPARAQAELADAPHP